MGPVQIITSRLQWGQFRLAVSHEGDGDGEGAKDGGNGQPNRGPLGSPQGGRYASNVGRDEKEERSDGDVTSNQQPRQQVAVGFIDILFGLAAGAAFLQFFNAGIEVRSHLAVALVVIALSWIGYHQTMSASPDVPEWGWNTVQFFVDVVIVGLYYVLVLAASKRGLAATARMVDEAALLVAVFGAYAVWDTLDLTYPGKKPM